MSAEKEKQLPRASDQPPVNEPQGYSAMRFSEEFKEALLRAKGEGRALMLTVKNGEWSVDGHVYSIEEVDVKNDTVKLKVLRPAEPTEAKKQLVKSLVEKLKSRVHGSIDSAIESALLEKSDGDLEFLAKSKTGGIKRTRGCFWLDVEDTEVLL